MVVKFAKVNAYSDAKIQQKEMKMLDMIFTHILKMIS